MSCIFCNISEEMVFENKLAYAICDGFPVNKGHMLVITKRHVSSYFDATEEEIIAIQDLLLKCKDHLDKLYKPDGYNVGINIGIPAGQSIMHLHVHIIPRYIGDLENPKGGVRGVLPFKRHY